MSRSVYLIQVRVEEAAAKNGSTFVSVLSNVTETPLFTTFGSALHEVYFLLGRGWEVLRDDRPEIAEIAFRATKGLSSQRLTWRPYGYLLVPEIQKVEDEEGFYELFSEHLPHRMFKCDALEVDMLGFVCYCKRHKRKSTVFRFPLGLVKELGPVFLHARNAAQTENLQTLLADT